MLAPFAFLPTQLPTPSAPPLIGARSLSLSPDGTRLAFSYQGDVWTSSAKGGRAIPVTNNVEMDDNPVWSPDGEYIAFVSNRSGNNDIYIVPSEGGTTRRLTWYTGSDVPSDWSSDGKTILLSGKRDSSLNGVMTIDVASGKTKQIFLDMMPVGSPRFTPDGKGILYTRFGFPWTRPRYEGSAAAQLWRYDLATGQRTKVSATGFQHLWPNVSAEGRVLCVTVGEKTPNSSPLNKSIGKWVDNVKRTPNVYAVDGRGGQNRLTEFVGEGARFLTVAEKAPLAAFERDGDVYTMGLNGGKPEKIVLRATLDDKTTQEERLTLTSGVSDMSLSPKNDTLAFVVRNEIWTVPVKKGTGPNANDATQLTDWAGLDEQPLWAPDGKTLYFVSDRNGPSRLFRMDVATKTVMPVSTGGDIADVRITPDKTKVSFWQTGADGGLYTVPVGGGVPTRVLSKPGQSIGTYDWSPDGRYVAYLDVLRRSGYYYWESTSNLFILDTATGKSTNVTKLSSNHGAPKWTPDGRYLLMRSDREEDGLYAIALQPQDTPTAEIEMKYTAPTAPVKVEIDFDGIDRRIRKLNGQGPDALDIDKQTGDIWFLSGGDLWRAPYSGENPQRVTQTAGATPAPTPQEPPRRRGFPGVTGAAAGTGPVQAFTFSDDGNQIAYLRGGMMNVMQLRRPGNPSETVAFRADWTHDLRAERKAAYDQIWRAYNRGFYDPNFHGRDFPALRARYEKFLPSVGHRNEMATVLNMMIGNLESSHSEVSPGPGNPPSQSSAHLGFTWDPNYTGPGIKVQEVPVNTPGSYTKSKLNPGDVVNKINGKEVQVDEALFRDVLNEQTGREVTLTVQGTDGKERTVKFRAISPGAFNSIVFANLLEARRKRVEERSGGKLTYVHIAGMGETELRRFNQQVWEQAADKKGLIIDVRNNGGGNTSDRIIDVLERQPNAYYQLRDEAPMLGPGQALAVPIAVLMGETSYSNAEMFPAAMKARKLATLVGMPTPGYVIYTGGLRLVDGTNARMPGTGAFTLEGENLEDNGRQPDVKVDITPEQYLRGEDPQLDAAIDVLIRQVR
ncbi:PDZ domain-containing protein [bacterium]|nr:MAG: PDZ domain-containing protein [bacterium]